MNSPLKPNPKVFQSPSLFIEPECILPVQMLYNRRVRHQLVLICELYWWLSLLSISLSLSSGWLSPPSIYTHKSSSPSPLLTCALYNKQICWKREKKPLHPLGEYCWQMQWPLVPPPVWCLPRWDMQHYQATPTPFYWNLLLQIDMIECELFHWLYSKLDEKCNCRRMWVSSSSPRSQPASQHCIKQQDR